MNGCDKVKIICQKGCGEVLQNCDTIDHQKECPFRILECEYCKENVRANQVNEHIRLCEHHPDGVVTCPYMEVGCDTIEIARKNLETHITQNVISHQKLLLHELNQLRTENKQLRADNEQLRVTNESTKQFIQSHEQSIQSLMSTAGFITEYIADRGKTLQGVEWTHGYRKGEAVYGPILYLGQCKLRIHVVGRYPLNNSLEYDACYYVTRLKGDNDDIIDSLTITYIHLYNVNLSDNIKYNIESVKKDAQLKVGDKYYINSAFSFWNKFDELTTVRIFFDKF
ncbi:TNF receptor-associated factor 6-like isoform X3 [Oopsacas minuta]|uniref:TNF receptor-associated factor 6-like isoform X3 n=1 Tax=Oopsacas minuta TaxID=111878 RepID=A0AAV7JDH9_9METZ|nr:TNF receptor-associated factor 6-like isoform X3 [Oopsacas minuta]